MIYDVSAIVMLARACAPAIATEAVVPLVVAESGGDPLQINVNGGPRLRATSAAGGAALARRYMAAGYTVDVGLAQINSANLARLGVSVERAFEPCTNLRLASTILQQAYGLARRHYAGLDAISATYSLYNTGTLTRGIRNGYVGRVWSTAVRMGSITAPPALPAAPLSSGPAALAGAEPAPDRSDWVVGAPAGGEIEVFR